MVSSLYDPLGLVSPFTLPVKLVLQSLCKKGLKWDEPIPDKESKEYRKWIETIDSLENIKVPRCSRKVQAKYTKVQLHCFADASDSGYGVAIYARFQYSDQSIECNLVVGKLRVAPLKKITIPRMELTRATLAVKLANVVTNRLTTIHEGSNVEDWHYIASDLNPADLASRGMHGNCDEDKISRWFQGPEFLSKPMSEWPESRNFKCTIIPDEMASKVAHATVIKEDSFMSSLTNRYSTWTKLKRIVGWVILECRKFKQKKNGEIDKDIILSKEILNEAEKVIVQLEQQNYFSEETKSMKDTKTLNVGKGSPLYKLDPIITLGVLRVGGRLNNCLRGNTRSFCLNSLMPKMADLPKERVTPEEPPFTKVGMDYFGPFEVKRGRNTVKRYGVIFTCLASRAGIEWEFNPASSHFGGVWERMIRSVRKILYSLAKEKIVTLDDESLVTLMHEIEAILNNRPLTANPNVPSDLEALTPNHLLQLRPGNEMALGDFSEDCYSRKRWKQMQHLVARGSRCSQHPTSDPQLSSTAG
ncbi:uncharacterized protein LOC125028654 [Penaeus chinensis]|uniref:uncharacterized protein LOC125028654 n=1 Tax=Penaeus chinensis TaxID=139456 RepID=UPI001FB57546|nr:uncharacterized protein LOC125028654 [Penaeus chinensis]